MPLTKESETTSEHYRAQRKQWLDLANSRLALTERLRYNMSQALTIGAYALSAAAPPDSRLAPIGHAVTLAEAHSGAFDATGLWIDTSVYRTSTAAEQAELASLLAKGVPTLPLIVGFSSLAELAKAHQHANAIRTARSQKYEPSRAPVMAAYQGYSGISGGAWQAGVATSLEFLGNAVLLDPRNTGQVTSNLALINTVQWAISVDNTETNR